MKFRYWFIEWTWIRFLGAIGVAFVILFVLFVSLNVPTGPVKEVTGVVLSVSADPATIYDLPTPVINVDLNNGKKVSVKGIRGSVVSVGDQIVLVESKRLLSPGIHYTVKR